MVFHLYRADALSAMSIYINPKNRIEVRKRAEFNGRSRYYMLDAYSFLCKMIILSTAR